MGRAGLRLFVMAVAAAEAAVGLAIIPRRLSPQAVGQPAEHESPQGRMTGTAVDLIWLAPASRCSALC